MNCRERRQSYGGANNGGVEAIREGAETNEEGDCEIVAVSFGSDMRNHFYRKACAAGGERLEIEQRWLLAQMKRERDLR